MSDGAIRLGAPPAPAPLPLVDRLRHRRPVLGIAILGEREGVRAALSAAAAETTLEVVRLRVLLRTRPGIEWIEKEGALEAVAASAPELRSALTEALSRLPAHDVLVLEGSVGLGRVRTDLAVLVSGGAHVSEWPADLRALKDELALVWSEPREKTIAELLRGLATRAAQRPSA